MADKSPSKPKPTSGKARFAFIDCHTERPVFTIYQLDNGDLMLHSPQKDPLWLAAFNPDDFRDL